MHVDIVPNRQSPPCILLRESYRDERGKVRKRTIANVTNALDLEQAYQLREFLRGAPVGERSLEEAFEVVQSLPHGHVAATLGVMDQLKLGPLLAKSDSPHRRNALALIAGRILSPGSKLALSRNLRGQASTLSQELDLDDDLSENDLYEAMHWLWNRQGDIEKRLAKRHLDEGCVVLYDLSSSYYEGKSCELARFGHNRDKKRGKAQINYGLVTDSQGRPISVEVYPGNTGDPVTLTDQLDKLKKRFNLSRVIVVGDRGMVTQAPLQEASQEESEFKDYGWISALDSSQIRKLVTTGAFQPELFDQAQLAEISSPEFPNQRLVACRNPLLAQHRTDKRNALLQETQEALESIQQACRRARNPYHGRDRISRRVEREAAKYKVLKHFTITITETDLEFERNQDSIEAEARLDGFYIVRAQNVSSEEMDSEDLVDTYKSLCKVEQAFSRIKTRSLRVRPIFHRRSDMVQAHIFLCMLAYYVQWHMEHRLAPSLFADEELAAQKAKRPNPVKPTQRSQTARRKAETKHSADGLAVHSFQTLLNDLASICRVSCRPAVKGAKTFEKLTIPNEVQQKALDLLDVKLKL